MWAKLQTLDRRVIYLFFIVALLIPLFRPIGLPIKVGEDVQLFYDRFAALPPNSVIWMSPDYSPGSGSELNPQFIAVMKHAFSLGYRVIVYGMWEDGTYLAKPIAESVAAEMGKVHGVDWAYLGWRPGGEAVIRMASEDLWDAVGGRDGYDQPLSELPLMRGVRKLWPPEVNAIVCFSSGSPGDGNYMRVITDPSGMPLFTGQVAVQVPARMPLIRSEQIQGLIPGMGGAAEYERVSGFLGAAAGLMDAQSLAHVVILGFIILGNIAYIASRKK
jgi:hypothetical protein